MFIKQDTSDVTRSSQESGLILCVGLDGFGCRREVEVLGGREVNGEGEHAACDDETARDVNARDARSIPGVDEEKNGLGGDPDGIALVGHNLKAFVEIPIQVLHNHCVMVFR
jgi:hypothetical protein